jgi:hypothetical protein
MLKDLITIVFYGLISHVDVSPVAMNAAVLPVVANHQPYLCVSATDMIAASLPSSLPSYIAQPDPANPGCPNQYEVDLRAAKVEFDGIDEKTTFYTKEFTRYVSSLSALSNCRTLKANVRSRTHGGGSSPVDSQIGAFVDYPGGTLAVDSYFAMRGKVAGSTSPYAGPQCFACKVALTMATSGIKVGVTVSKHRSTTGGVFMPIRFEVRSQARLLVTNAPMTSTTNHFAHHYRIFTSCAGLNLKPTSEACDLPPCPESGQPVTTGTQPDADVECSQTRYP